MTLETFVRAKLHCLHVCVVDVQPLDGQVDGQSMRPVDLVNGQFSLIGSVQ